MKSEIMAGGMTVVTTEWAVAAPNGERGIGTVMTVDSTTTLVETSVSSVEYLRAVEVAAAAVAAGGGPAPDPRPADEGALGRRPVVMGAVTTTPMTGVITGSALNVISATSLVASSA